MTRVSFLNDIVTIRRLIHASPELAFKETRTALLVAFELEKCGLKTIKTGIGKTGVIGIIEGQKTTSGVTIGLRADMDALPITEESGQPWSSTVPGVMHACGHDGHTAILLGTARHLALTRNFNGRVMVVFQPAEEGWGGARSMIEDGLFQGDLDCQSIYALHNTPYVPLGQAVIAEGLAMASSDTIKISVKGAAGHAGAAQIKNPVVPLSLMIGHVPKIMGKFDRERAILQVTNLAAGNGVIGKIPQIASASGTLRALCEDTRAQVKQRLAEVFYKIANKHDVALEITYPSTTGQTINTPAEKELATFALNKVFGEKNVDPRSNPPMFAEDFGDMLRHRPGAYCGLGQGSEKGLLHTSKFDFDDRLLLPGIKYFTTLVEHAMPLNAAGPCYSLV